MRTTTYNGETYRSIRAAMEQALEDHDHAFTGGQVYGLMNNMGYSMDRAIAAVVARKTPLRRPYPAWVYEGEES